MPSEREVRRVLKRLAQEGWVRKGGRGSHRTFVKGGVTLCVPTSKRELPVGTYRSIAMRAGRL